MGFWLQAKKYFLAYELDMNSRTPWGIPDAKRL